MSRMEPASSGKREVWFGRRNDMVKLPFQELNTVAAEHYKAEQLTFVVIYKSGRSRVSQEADKGFDGKSYSFCLLITCQECCIKK